MLLRGMWGLPGPGLEPVSPALAGRLSTAAPPGKPEHRYFYDTMLIALNRVAISLQMIMTWYLGYLVAFVQLIRHPE